MIVLGLDVFCLIFTECGQLQMNISIQISFLLGAKFMGTKKLIVCNLLSFSLKPQKS